MQANGSEESLVILQVEPNSSSSNKFGRNAVVFTGRADTGQGPIYQQVTDLKNNLDDKDTPFSWDLDIVVGPKWRTVIQVAPFISVEQVVSNDTDEDDWFQFAVRFRQPAKWSVTPGAPMRIVLHVTVTQAGEKLWIFGLNYNVTATGDLLL